MKKFMNYSNVLKQETELLIPAQTGNRTIELILSVDRWPPKRKDMQLMIGLIILIILIVLIILVI